MKKILIVVALLAMATSTQAQGQRIITNVYVTMDIRPRTDAR